MIFVDDFVNKEIRQYLEKEFNNQLKQKKN